MLWYLKPAGPQVAYWQVLYTVSSTLLITETRYGAIFMRSRFQFPESPQSYSNKAVTQSCGIQRTAKPVSHHGRIGALFLLKWTLSFGESNACSEDKTISNRLSYVDLQNVLSTLVLFHTVLVLVKELTLQQMRSVNGLTREIHWSYHFPTILNSCLKWTGLLKIHFQRQPGWQHFARLVQCTPSSGICSKSAFSIECGFPTVRIHWSRNQGVEKGAALLTISHRDPLAKIVLPPGDSSNSIDLEIETPSPPATFRCSCLSIGEIEDHCSGWGDWS